MTRYTVTFADGYRIGLHDAANNQQASRQARRHRALSQAVDTLGRGVLEHEIAAERQRLPAIVGIEVEA